MDAETFLGAILIAAWAALVLRGLTRTALAARKRGKWERAYLVGLGVGCALWVGVVLSIKNSLPLDTFTIGFLLAAGAGFAVWAFGRNPPLQRRSRMPSVTRISLRNGAQHEGECELGTLAIGKRCQERISDAESALDTLYVARNRG
jgi:hypothetical protein